MLLKKDVKNWLLDWKNRKGSHLEIFSQADEGRKLVPS
jgi:hypothetical protein